MHEKLDATMKSLKKSATDWINTFDSVMDAVFLLDNEKHIVRLNKAALQLTRKTEEAAIGIHIRNVYNLKNDAERERLEKNASQSQKYGGHRHACRRGCP